MLTWYCSGDSIVFVVQMLLK